MALNDTPRAEPQRARHPSRAALARTQSSRPAEQQLGRILGWIAVAIWIGRRVVPRRRGLLGRWTASLFDRARTKHARVGAAAMAVSGATLLALFEKGRRRRRAATQAAIDIHRSITIGRSPEELKRLLDDPGCLEKIVGFARITGTDHARTHWTMTGRRRTYEWDLQRGEGPSGEPSWVSLPGAPLHGELAMSFHPAPGDWGTEVTLNARIEPKSAALRAATGLLGPLPKTIASKALHRFKSLAETGEIPTTHGQPAARNGGRDP